MLASSKVVCGRGYSQSALETRSCHGGTNSDGPRLNLQTNPVTSSFKGAKLTLLNTYYLCFLKTFILRDKQTFWAADGPATDTIFLDINYVREG